MTTNLTNNTNKEHEESTTNHTNLTNFTNKEHEEVTMTQSNSEEKKEAGLIYKEECFEIYSCIYAVNRKLGSGFLEAVYHEALEIELRNKKIPFVSQQKLDIIYDGIPLSAKYIADIICYNKIIIELKSVSTITNQHKAQLMNYLAITGYKLGILVNFNAFPKAEIIRIAR